MQAEPWWWNLDVDTTRLILLPNQTRTALEPNRWLCALSGSRQNPRNENKLALLSVSQASGTFIWHAETFIRNERAMRSYANVRSWPDRAAACT